ncbi:MAG TPA: hypothetical protein VLX92_25250 [Kofleriaceae bacterium]|nr:hypothetical protein [Kofleriaceae bacterium]
MVAIKPRIRLAVACAASLAIAIRLYLVMPHAYDSAAERIFTYATIAVPGVAALLIWSRALAAQLLARGTWWSMLLLGTLVAMIGDRDARHVAAFAAACSALALIAAGSRGLDSRGRFTPVAFRGTLLVALVLAMADAGGLAWFGAGSAVFEHRYSVVMVVPLMIVGVIGLLRLRTWGLIVSMIANATIVVLAAAGVLTLPTPLRQLFIGSAALQLIIPLPMIVSIVRGRAPDPTAFRRTKAVAPIVVIVALAGASLLAASLGHPLLFV